MRNAHFSFMAGTAVALVLTAASTLHASPFNQDSSYVTPSSSRTPTQFGPASTEGTTRNAVPQRQPRRDTRDYEPASPPPPAQRQSPQSRNNEGQNANGQNANAQGATYRAPVLTKPQTTAAPIITAPAPQPIQSVTPAYVPSTPAPAPAPVNLRPMPVEPAPMAEPIRPAIVEPVRPEPVRPESVRPMTSEPARPAPAVVNEPPAKPTIAAPERPGIPDQQVGERIKDIVTGKRLDRFFSRKNEHDAAVAAYTANRFQPLWLSNGNMSERARSAVHHLRNIEADGLDPSDYPTPTFNAMNAEGLARPTSSSPRRSSPTRVTPCPAACTSRASARTSITRISSIRPT